MNIRKAFSLTYGPDAVTVLLTSDFSYCFQFSILLLVCWHLVAIYVAHAIASCGTQLLRNKDIIYPYFFIHYIIDNWFMSRFKIYSTLVLNLVFFLKKMNGFGMLK